MDLLVAMTRSSDHEIVSYQRVKLNMFNFVAISISSRQLDLLVMTNQSHVVTRRLPVTAIAVAASKVASCDWGFSVIYKFTNVATYPRIQIIYVDNVKYRSLRDSTIYCTTIRFLTVYLNPLFPATSHTLIQL